MAQSESIGAAAVIPPANRSAPTTANYTSSATASNAASTNSNTSAASPHATAKPSRPSAPSPLSLVPGSDLSYMWIRPRLDASSFLVRRSVLRRTILVEWEESGIVCCMCCFFRGLHLQKIMDFCALVQRMVLVAELFHGRRQNRALISRAGRSTRTLQGSGL